MSGVLYLLRKKTHQIIGEWDGVARYVGHDIGECEQEPSEEFGRPIVPQKNDLYWVPLQLAVDDLRRRCHDCAQELSQGDAHWQKQLCLPSPMSVVREPCNIIHVDGERSIRRD